MSGKTKGLLWTAQEIAVMLQTLYDLETGRTVMTSTNVETTTIFQKVSDVMLEKGFQRSVSQIRAKFKKEKGIFYDAWEEYGDLPPKDQWGPRFPFLVQLWEQAGKPDPKLRRPAACGKHKNCDRLIGHRVDPAEPSSTTVTACPASPGCNPSVNTGQDDEDCPRFLLEGRKPTFSEIITEVLSLRTDVNRLRKSIEFLRQGIVRMRTEVDKIRMESAVRQQAMEMSSSEEEDDENDGDDGSIENDDDEEENTEGDVNDC